MKRTSVLASRFREVLLNGTWIANTNYHQQLTGMPYEIAIEKAGNLNTIADLAQHIHYYVKGIADVLAGGPLQIRDQYSFDFAPITTKEEWELFLNLFWREAERFASLVEQMEEEKLEAPFVDVKYGTYQRNIDGMIEHCYYHLGQIVLLKKLLSSANGNIF